MPIVALCLAVIALIGVVVFLVLRLGERNDDAGQAERSTPQYDFSRYERQASVRNRHVVLVRPQVTDAVLAEEVWDILVRACEPMSVRAIRKKMRVRGVIPEQRIPSLDNFRRIIDLVRADHLELKSVQKQGVTMHTVPRQRSSFVRVGSDDVVTSGYIE